MRHKMKSNSGQRVWKATAERTLSGERYNDSEPTEAWSDIQRDRPRQASLQEYTKERAAISQPYAISISRVYEWRVTVNWSLLSRRLKRGKSDVPGWHVKPWHVSLLRAA